MGGTAKYKTKNQPVANSWGFLNTDGFRSECNLMEPEIEPDGNLIIERSELSISTNGSVYVDRTIINPDRRVRINNKGQLLVKNGESVVALPKEFLIARNFENGLAVVQDFTGYWGAVDVNGKILVTLQYTNIKNFSENKSFARNKTGKLCLISTNGTIIKEFDGYSEGYSFKGGYAIVVKGRKHGLINSNGKEILPPLDGYIRYTNNPHEFEIISYGGKHGLFMASTGLLIQPRFNKIIEVKKDCIKVEVDETGEGLIDLSGNVFVEKDKKRITFPDWCKGVKIINESIFKGITDNGKWGLLDSSGETLLKPEFDKVGELDSDIIPLTKKETVTVGGRITEKKEISKYGLYNVNSKVFIPVESDTCPEYLNGYYMITSKGLLGIIKCTGEVVLNPEWRQIHLSNEYFIVSKIVKENDSESERFGLTTLSGNIILETKYEAISVLCKGLYKVKENDSWSICNDACRLTNETYDEINIEGNYITVSKNGLTGRLNEYAEKVIKSENGDYLILPSKFSWGYDFMNGVAKVLISGCENYIDESFNIVIKFESQIIPIDKSIDYIVSKDKKGNYIFVRDEKYGIIDHSGITLIEAKYQYLSHFSNDFYIAGIIKEDDCYNTYGIIDIEDNTILAFEYSSIKPYDGKITRNNLSWNDEYVKEQIETPKEVQNLLVHKNGYGLLDRNGKICIPPEYNDIQQFENGFFVKTNDKYGVIDSNYIMICKPKYSTIRPVGNGLWMVSIVTSQKFDRDNEVYGILDSYGKERLSPIYQFIGDIDDNKTIKGRAVISLKGKLGLVDENYCIIVEPQYEHISEFKNGKATVDKHVHKHNMSGVDILRGEIDINGNFTDISEIPKTEEHKINDDVVLNSSIKTVKTLKNGFEVIQKDDPTLIIQYCAIIDKFKKIILPYKYHEIEELENGMYLVYLFTGNSGKYGLLDQEFKEIIRPKYKNLRLIEDVLIASNIPACYTSRSNSGIIDLKENIVLPFDYSSIEFATDGLVWIHKDQKIGLATTDGKVLIEPCFGKIEPFENGFAKVNNGYWFEYEEDNDSPVHNTKMEYSEGKWGLINSEGILILPSIYDSILVLETNQIIVSRSISLNHPNIETHVSGVTNYQGELLIKDRNGKYILASKKYQWQEDFNAEGKSRVYYEGNIGVVNEEFQQIVTCQLEGQISEIVLHEGFDWGYNSESQYIIIEKDSKKGIIDHTNRIIIQPLYDIIDILSDNTRFVFRCCAHNTNNKCYLQSYLWSIINVEGKPVIDIQSEDIIYLGFSLFAIKNSNHYSIVDFNGQSTSATSFDSVFCFGVSSSKTPSHSLDKPKTVNFLNFAIVGLEGKYGIIDNKGRLVIHPKYSSLSIQNNGQFLADGILINILEQKIIVKDKSIFIIPGDYDTIERLDNGLFLVSKNKLFGCINQIGTVIIPLKYRSLTCHGSLLIAICYDDTDETYRRGVLDFQERQILPFSQQIDEIQIDSEIILYKQSKHWGAYTLQGKIISEPIYDHIAFVAHNLIKVGKDGTDYDPFSDFYLEHGERYYFTAYNEYPIINWGLIDYNANEILPLEYKAIADKVIDGLLEICLYDRIGYLDLTGRVILEPTYMSVGAFVDGYAVVSKSSSYRDEEGFDIEKSVFGVINSQFKEIIPCVFDRLEYEAEMGRFKTEVGYMTIDGRYVVLVDGKELYLDKKYKYCEQFVDTTAIAVRVVDGHVYYGLVDKKSNDILPPIFSSLEHIDNGLYKFKINDLYGLVTSKGNIILQNKYNNIGKFDHNLACVQVNVLEKQLYGFVDSSGNEILPPSYEFIGERYHNYSVVMKNNLWGLFGLENHQIKLFPNVSFLGPCMDNLCKINVGGIYDINRKTTTGGHWGYATLDGKIVIEPTYEQAYGFSDGMAAVKLNGKWGFINSEGIIVVPFEYDEVEDSYKHGKGKLVKGDGIFVFDKSGSTIDIYDKPRDDDDDYYGGYYDDTPSIYDNPYYDDNLDLDQQSIEFWDSL